MANVFAPGPLLNELLDAQAAERDALRQPCLGQLCRALESRCAQLAKPVVWPVGAAAERLAGAASFASPATVDVWDRHSRLDGRIALVLVIVDLTGVALAQGALHARHLGAVGVHACGVHAAGVETVENLVSYRQLTATQSQRRSA